MTNETTKAILLARVSSKEQEETGYSLPAQEKLLAQYAGKHSFTTAKVFSISETASKTTQRKTFDQMMRYAQKYRIKVVVCEKADRLTRNFNDMVAIDDWLEADEERQVHLVKDGLVLHKNSRSQERLRWGIQVLFAKNYIDNLKEEIRKGQIEKLEQGWLPTKPPLGYQSVGEQKKRIHVINSDIAPLIKEMFELYAKGQHSLQSLSEVMYDKGLRSRNGNRIKKHQVHRFLTDPFYYGRNRWNGQIYPVPGKQEPIISKEVFDRVQELMRRKNAPKYNKHFYTFKGLVRCADCGGKITWEPHKGKLYGHCNYNYTNCITKGRAWYKEAELEEEIVGIFQELQVKHKRLADWIKKSLLESHKDKIEYHETTLAELDKREREINQWRDRIYDDLVKGKILQERYDRKDAEYASELDDVLGQRKKLAKASSEYYVLGVSIYQLSQKSNTIYYKAKKPEQKRKLLNVVFEKLEMADGKLAYEYTPAFEFLAKAVAETNSSKMVKMAEKLPAKLEPMINVSVKEQIRISDRVRSELCRERDSNSHGIAPAGF